jgi:uncharacterized protein YgiM (DUF1202 family)
MNKFLFTLAFLVQTLVVSAAAPNPNPKAAVSRVSIENVKMYSQAATSTQVLRALKSTDEVLVVRKHNNLWSIVTVDGQVGYVLTSELTQPKDMKHIARAHSGRTR